MNWFVLINALYQVNAWNAGFDCLNSIHMFTLLKLIARNWIQMNSKIVNMLICWLSTSFRFYSKSNSKWHVTKFPYSNAHSAKSLHNSNMTHLLYNLSEAKWVYYRPKPYAESYSKLIAYLILYYYMFVHIHIRIALHCLIYLSLVAIQFACVCEMC